MHADILPALGTILSKAFVGLVITGVGTLLIYPFKKAIRWTSEIKEELVHQRRNCLTTLQAQGNQQVELLTKVVGTLESMHLDQRETLAIIRDRK